RTRPLSPLAPMVLGPQGPGRVGRRQAKNHCRCYSVVVFIFSEDHLIFCEYTYPRGAVAPLI
ncbi:hypothetical protein, partial [Paenibacillus xylanexedens]|uniref:hypothetical protein n=1 Tax=Paenibacillus xylanexedens TaxID=528191 RepID=UPI001C92D30D